MDNRPVVYWILQENQLTPAMVDYLKFFVQQIPNLNIQFCIPSMWQNTLEMGADLNPIPFDGILHNEESYDWVCRKRDALEGTQLPGGLDAWRVLLLDDMNGGVVHPVVPKLPDHPNVKFIILQLPIPLGSTANEERMFYASVHWAHLRKIPVIGYELLPFDTKWTLLQALVDGVITNNETSYDWLTSPMAAIPGKVWCLPRYEAQLMCPMTPPFWHKSIGVPHHFIRQANIPDDALNIYIPHKVAMSHELMIMIRRLARVDRKIHLMISVGKDQGRGTHTHQEIVETLNREDLGKFFSYAFHDIQNGLDMSLADGILACSSCYATFLANQSSIPSLIIDPDIMPSQRGYSQTANSYDALEPFLDQLAAAKKKTSRMDQIFTEVLNALNP